jgi:hypothetical protein
VLVALVQPCGDGCAEAFVTARTGGLLTSVRSGSTTSGPTRQHVRDRKAEPLAVQPV